MLTANNSKSSSFHQRGFTLMELLIVVVVIGILAAMMMPLYQNYVSKTRRTTTEGQLLNLAQGLENYRAQNFSYKGADQNGLWKQMAPDLAKNKFYSVSLKVGTNDQSYTITATPQKSQSQDGVLMLNDDGDSCRDESNSGTCTLSNGSSW